MPLRAPRPPSAPQLRNNMHSCKRQGGVCQGVLYQVGGGAASMARYQVRPTYCWAEVRMPSRNGFELLREESVARASCGQCCHPCGTRSCDRSPPSHTWRDCSKVTHLRHRLIPTHFSFDTINFIGPLSRCLVSVCFELASACWLCLCPSCAPASPPSPAASDSEYHSVFLPCSNRFFYPTKWQI